MDAERPPPGGVAVLLRWLRARTSHRRPALAAARLQDAVPLVGQLHGHSPQALRGDLRAALGVAVILVPQGLAYGAVAGLAPAAGLYTAVGAAVAFSLVSATRFLAVGPSAAVAALTFEAIHGPAGHDPARAAALAAGLSVLAGVLYILLVLLRMTAVTDLLSEPVMLGYLAGTGVVIFAGQLGVLLGVPAGGTGPLEKLWHVLTHLPQAQPLTVTVGLSAVTLLVLLRRYRPGWPALFVVLALAVAASAALGLAGRGVDVVGAVSGGLPSLAVPQVPAAEVWSLLPAAAAIALIGFVETVAALRATTPPQQRLSLGREFTALGAASVASGALGGFGPSGSYMRSLGARGAGARSQLWQLVAAALVLVVLFLGGPAFARLPLAVLAAAVIAGSLPGLFDLRGFARLWRGWRAECLIALATAAGVVGLGILRGMVVAVLLAVGQLVRRSARPHDAVLAVTSPDRPPREVDPHDLPRTDVLIYRVDAPLFFANAGRIRERVLDVAAAGGTELRYVVLDAEAVFYLDATAADAVAQLSVDLRERGCGLALARARDPVLAALRRNPYHDGATQDLPAFASVRQAHAALTATE